MIAVVLLAVGCGALRPVPLDVPPGQRVVLGRVDLSAFEVAEATLDIVKEDGTFQSELAAGLRPRDFAIALPPGRYRVARLRAFQDRRGFPNDVSWELRLAFEVGPEPAVYIGTLRLAGAFGRELRVTVADEYEDTVRVLRAWHPDLPAAVVRSLLRPR